MHALPQKLKGNADKKHPMRNCRQKNLAQRRTRVVPSFVTNLEVPRSFRNFPERYQAGELDADWFTRGGARNLKRPGFLALWRGRVQ